MKFLSTLLTFVALVFAAPSVLIVASWNALPGDPLYPFKKGLETIILTATGWTPLAPKFSVQFTERRFSEANKLLATQGSTVGFALLAQEARATKEIIVEKSDSQTAGELLFKIEGYQENIVAQQQALTTQVVAQPSTLPVPQEATTQQPTPVVVTQISTPTPTPGVEKPQATAAPVLLPKITEPVKAKEAVIKLEETKHDLEKIKEEMKRDLPEATKRAAELREERQEKREEERQAKDEKEQKREQKERED